jgi:altronate hydrolase
MILFTTGRGTPLGFPVPTVKIATNSVLATRKQRWIDFDAGSVMHQSADWEAVTSQLWQLVLDVASGTRRTKNELSGFHEIAIWKRGVTL